MRTNPFVPFLVCAASDGTVWGVGHELEKEESRKNYAMLRQYSFSKGLLRNSFPPGLSSPAVSNGPQGAFLRCGKDRVVFYANLTNEYVEISGATHAGRRWNVDMSSLGRMKVSGFAVTDTGSVYASLDEDHNGGNPGFIGLYELKTDRATMKARWLPVKGTTGFLERGQGIPRGTFLGLWGTDGKNLVVSRAGEGHLSWATPILETVPH